MIAIVCWCVCSCLIFSGTIWPSLAMNLYRRTVTFQSHSLETIPVIESKEDKRYLYRVYEKICIIDISKVIYINVAV